MLSETLNDRQRTHGSFKENAEISQQLKNVWRMYNKGTLNAIQMEALDMICLKISRILSNSNEIDHWHDIVGYATLVENDLKQYKVDINKVYESRIADQPKKSLIMEGIQPTGCSMIGRSLEK